jgi:hypothetical protein
MKRDLDLMREILLAVEASHGEIKPPYLPGKPRPEAGAEMSPADAAELTKIHYQVRLLSDAGYIEASFAGPWPEPYFSVIRRLTNSGHDYLDSVRDPKVWERTKKELAKVPGGSGPMEFVKDLAAKTLVELYKSSSGP